MKDGRHIIWSNDIDYDDWREDLEEQYPDLTEAERMELMYELNGDYLDDERSNLDIQLSRPILVVGDLGLWHGRRMGYKEIPSGNTGLGVECARLLLSNDRVFFIFLEVHMNNTKVTLAPLEAGDREQFILDNQESFKYGAVEEFGLRDDHFEEDGEIISRATIEQSIDAPDSEAYRILYEGRKVGGVVLKIDKETHHNELELLFVLPKEHSKGIGYGAWLAVEALHPETEVWETCTPYFEKRNIHFYINKCSFHAVEFFSAMHPDPNPPEKDEQSFPGEGPDEMFRFEKVMK